MNYRVSSLIIILVLLTSGCFNSQETASPVATIPLPQARTPIEEKEIKADEPTARPRWSLQYRARCNQGAPENCPGHFGMQLTSDGTFVIGPGPDGQRVSGNLSSEDLTILESYQEKLNSLDQHLEALNTKNCIKVDPTENRLSVEFNTNQGKKSWIKISEQELCFSSASRQDALELKLALQNMVHRYYPNTFPSTCANAAWRLEQLYTYLQFCRWDTDCSLIDNNFAPIPEQKGAVHISEDCNYVKPLVVANAFRTISNQRELMEKWELTQEICSTDPAWNRDDSIKKHFIVKDRPVCVQGLCRINSGTKQ